MATTETNNLESHQPLIQEQDGVEDGKSILNGSNGRRLSDSECEDGLTLQNGMPDRHGGTSNLSTIMHIIKGSVGTGILAMPYAFSQSGILVGTVCLLILGIICLHTMHQLVKCSHHLCAKVGVSSLDYAGVAEEAFRIGPPPLPTIARHVVNTFLMITQFGFCCVYILFVSQNIQFVVMKLMGNVGEDCDLHKPMILQLYELCVVALLIPFVFIRNVRHLTPFSTLANIATVAGLSIIMYDILIREGLNSVSRLPLFNGWDKLPLYFGSAMFAFEGIGVILPLENRMREPSALPPLFGVLNLSLTIVVALYITVGFYGYIEFGEKAAGSITLNITSWYGIAVQLLFAFSIFVTYGVQFFVPMDIIGDVLITTRFAQYIGPRVFDYLFRATLVIITYMIAAIVDRYLDLLISVVGALSSSAIAITFPPLLEMVTFWPVRAQTKGYWAMFMKDCLIITIGCVGCISGTAVALQQLIARLSSHDASGGCPPADS